MSQLLLDQVDPLGDTLAVNPPFYVSGNIWYVDSATGDDTNSGKEQKHPLATINQAHANAASGDVVFLMDGHAEAITSNFSFTKAITWVGCGLEDDEPTVTFTLTASGLLTVSGDMIELRNIKVVVGSGTGGLSLEGLNLLVKGCRIECGDGASYGIRADTNDETLRIEDTVIVSTATDATTLPGPGIKLNDGGVENLWLIRVTVDGGTLGFSGGIGITGHNSLPAVVHFRAEKLSLLNGADLDFSTGTAPTNYWIQIDQRSGGAQLRGLTGQYLPNGLGEETGDVLATDGPLYTSGDVWYVHSGTGTDAASPAGQERLKPLATIAQAFTNAAAGDIIVLRDGHAEAYTSGIFWSDQATIVGGGSANGAPTVTYTMSGSGEVRPNAATVEIRNVKFVTTGNGVTMQSSGENGRIVGCRFELGDAANFGLRASDVDEMLWVENTTFVVTATTTAPGPGMDLDFAGAENVMLYNVVFDGGAIGFADGVAFSPAGGSPAGAVLRAVELTLLRGADMEASNAVNPFAAYWLQPTVVTGGAAIRTE